MADTFSNRWLQSRSSLRLYERAFIVYLLFSALVALLSYRYIYRWYGIVIGHLLLVAVIYGAAYLPVHRHRVWRIVRDFYVFLLFPVLFKEFTVLSRSLFPYYIEPLLIASDRFFYRWIGDVLMVLQHSRLANEMMSLGYSTYYFLVPGLGLYLYVKRSFSEFELYAYRFCFTMFFCYALFVFMPARGPHHSLMHVDPFALKGYLFTWLVQLFQTYGSTTGAAFPSSHVAATWVAFFPLKTINRRLYFFLYPFMVLLTLSVFYLHYHYVLDALAGYVVALGLNAYFLKQESTQAIQAILIRQPSTVRMPRKLES